MGQTASTPTVRSQSNGSDLLSPPPMIQTASTPTVRSQSNGPDLISLLPDDLLSQIFLHLSPNHRTHLSLVSKTWLRIDSKSRQRLSLLANSPISALIPRLLDRFDSVTNLVLKSDRLSISINDQDLILISTLSPHLTRLKLRACKLLTPQGMSTFAKNSTSLKKLSIGSLTFGSKGINAIVDNSLSLEELSVKRLRGVTDAGDPIGMGVCLRLKSICLKEIYNGQCFGPLISGARNLRSLKLFRCSGDWDKLLEVICDRVSNLVEIHLERIQVSDIGLIAISNCANLEILHIVKTPECTNLGLKSVAENCRLLRKLHIDGWKTNRIGDDGLVSVAKHCFNLQELVLIGVNPTVLSLGFLATNCVRLERLALCGSDTVGDTEISCISTKCIALKKLCIKGCPISDLGMEALANGCSNLVKMKVKKCRGITIDGADWFRASRRSVTLNLDVVEMDNLEADVAENGLEVPGGAVVGSRSFKARLGLTAGRNLVSCTFRKLSSFGGSSSRNS